MATLEEETEAYLKCFNIKACPDHEQYDIVARFKEALAFEAGAERFKHVLGMLKGVLRDGLVEQGTIPDEEVETIFEHSASAVHFFKEYAPVFLPKRDDLDFRKIRALLMVHDVIEALTTDLNVHNPNHFIEENGAQRRITKDDKQKIERMAAEIIFEGLPYGRKLWFEYDDKETEEAKIAGDIEKIQHLYKAGEYVRAGYNIYRYDEFFETTLNAVKSDFGHTFMRHVMAFEKIPEVYRADLLKHPHQNGQHHDQYLPTGCGDAGTLSRHVA